MRRWREPRPTSWPATHRHRSLRRDAPPPRQGVTTPRAFDADRSVGAVGGVHEKAIAARDAGAQVLVVPAEELSAVDGDRLDVRGVEDLSRAVQLLQAA
jgi:hypothetical protein